MPTRNQSYTFPRAMDAARPVAMDGDGALIIDAQGKSYIDGACGAFVAILGHNPNEVADKIADQAHRLNFAYTGDFSSDAEHRLASKLAGITPPGLSRVWLTTSGSSANETALKLARHYHLLRGQPEKTKVISRWHSYHGSTIAALSMTGSTPRRRLYEPYLLDFPHVNPPYCYRCPVGRNPATCETECAEEIEAVIARTGARYISAMILEPIAGGPLGALVSRPDYIRQVREICDRHDVLLIVDEVVSGLGRSGSWFGIDDSGVIPDIITLAKGLGGGFVPIGAVIAHERIYAEFEASKTSFVHGESFTGHVMLGAAGSAVIDYIEDHGLIERIARLGVRLGKRMAELAAAPMVGDVRGKGFIYGVELVRDKLTKVPFDRSLKVSEQVVSAAAGRGVLLLSGNAAADGVNGDTIVVAPPYVTTEAQLDRITDALADSLTEVAATL